MLLFNNEYTTNYSKNNSISIHLMLLFNFHIRFLSWHSLYFNTSNVTIQLQKPLQRLWKSLDFNTSNVTIQLKRNVKLQWVSFISIHLMLLFNDMWVLLVAPVLNFNTSNVTIQRLACWYRTTAQAISIHLMLLFNYLLHIHILYYKAFQYI